jgi:hypothetical protein
VFLFEITLHDLFVTSASVSNDPELPIHVLLRLKAIDTFRPHALEHLVRYVNFSTAKFLQTLGCLVLGTLRFS